MPGYTPTARLRREGSARVCPEKYAVSGGSDEGKKPRSGMCTDDGPPALSGANLTEKGVFGMTAEVWLCPEEAARASSKSISTVRRLLRKGAIPGARRQSPGQPWSPWEIPLSGLKQIGLSAEPLDSPHALHERIRELESQLVLAHAEKEVVESALARLEALCERQQKLIDQLQEVSV